MLPVECGLSVVVHGNIAATTILTLHSYDDSEDTNRSLVYLTGQDYQHEPRPLLRTLDADEVPYLEETCRPPSTRRAALEGP